MYTTWKMIQYNIKIIFGNKFLYFLIAAVLVFLAIVVGNLISTGSMQTNDAFNLLTLAGALIIFYPVTFGIQGDKDARTLEIIFGIPNYRYRVWLMRNVLIYVIAFLIIAALAILVNVSLVGFNPFQMSFHVTFPLLFLGMLSFFLSTVTRSGNATAVIIIILGIALLMLSENLSLGYWNIFFNPYNVPSSTSQTAYQILAFKNKVFLSSGAIVFLLGGLLNLQAREKFLG
jgi:hypothetical protein